jgi:outer membrane protein TolC
MKISLPIWPVRALALAAAAMLATASPLVRAQAEAQVPSYNSLSALLARALPNDPQVRVAQTLLQVNDERRKQARSRLAPNLAVTVSQGSSAVSETSLLGFNDFDRSTQRADVALRWNLYNAGNDLAELRASATDLGAAEQELRRAREESAERITQAYLDLRRIDELLPRMRSRLASVQRLVALVRQQNQAGKASDADLQQAQAYLLDAEIAADQLEGERESSRQRLLRLTGETLVEALPVVLPDVAADQPPAESPDPPGRTGLQAAALLRAQAARERVRPWLSLAAPRIDLELRKALSDRTSPQVSSLEHRAWAITARWDLPLGGETVSRRTEAQRRAEAAEAEAERSERGIRTELDALLPRLDSARRSVTRLAGQIDQYRALIRAAELQFEAGRRTLAQIIQLHDSLYTAEQHRSDQAYQLQVGQLRRLSLTGVLLPALLGANAPG